MSPPIVKGGQGRSDASVAADATGWFWVAFAAVIALVVATVIQR